MTRLTRLTRSVTRLTRLARSVTRLARLTRSVTRLTRLTRSVTRLTRLTRSLTRLKRVRPNNSRDDARPRPSPQRHSARPSGHDGCASRYKVSRTLGEPAAVVAVVAVAVEVTEGVTPFPYPLFTALPVRRARPAAWTMTQRQSDTGGAVATDAAEPRI